MLDYTKAAFRQTVKEFKIVDYIRNVLTQIVYIGYLTYSVIAKSGILPVNIFLLSLSAVYFVFFLAVTKCGKETDPTLKKVKNGGKTVFVWIKRIVRIFTLGVTVYGVCETVGNVNPFTIIFTSLMIVSWIMQILFEVLIKLLTAKISLIIDGMEADVDSITKPFKGVGNFFKKVSGQEVEEKEPTKNQVFLKEKIEEHKASLKEKLLKAKEEKRQRKLDEKEEKRKAALQKKEEKKTQKDDEIALSKSGS